MQGTENAEIFKIISVLIRSENANKINKNEIYY